MANYISATRTNYFRVKDESLWKPWIDKLLGEDHVYDFTKTDENGTVYHGFGCYGSIDLDGYWEDVYDDDEDEDEEQLAPIERLQAMVADGDACIVFHAGWEKLRFVNGGVTVITSNDIDYSSLDELGIKIARELLHSQGYMTETSY